MLNKNLPYEIPPDEPEKLLGDIKENLSLSIAKADFEKGVYFWTRQLENYLELKYSLSLEDRKWFANLYFEMLCLPDVDYALVDQWAKTLWRLVEKYYFFDNDSFSWRWEPLYRLLERVLSPPQRQKVFPSQTKHIESICDLVPLISKWFEEGSTEKILSEFLPRFNPTVYTSFIPASGWLSTFIPHHVRQKYDPKIVSARLSERMKNLETFQPHEQLFWIPHLFDIWSLLTPSKAVDIHFLDLFGKLSQAQYGQDTFYFSKDQIQYLFTVAHRWFELPIGSGLSTTEGGAIAIGTKGILSSGKMIVENSFKAVDSMSLSGSLIRKKKDITRSIAKIIIFNLYPSNFFISKLHPYEKSDFVLGYLDTWIHALEGFFHPSNSGSWSGTLVKLLLNISEILAHRLRIESLPIRECGKTITHPICQYGSEFFLDNTSRDRLVNILKPVVLMSMFAKDSSLVSTAHSAIHYLMSIDAELIFYPLADRVYPSLESLVESHRTSSAVGALSAIALPMLHRKSFPHGATQLLHALNATLPAIDLNDLFKSRLATVFYIKVLMSVPLVDLSLREQVVEDSSDSLRTQIARSTALFEEWTHGLFDKFFYLMEHLNLSDPDSQEANFLHLLTFVIGLVAEQMKTSTMNPLAESVLLRTRRFLLENVTNNPIFFINDFTSAFANAYHDEMFTLLPLIRDRIVEEVQSGAGSSKEKGFRADQADNDFGRDTKLAWNLKVLRGLITALGHYGKNPQLLKLQLTGILDTLDLCWSKCTSRPIYKLVTAAYKSIFKSMGELWVMDFRSFTEGTDPLSEIDSWGVPPLERSSIFSNEVDFEKLKVKWHIPSQTEKELLLYMAGKLVPKELELLRNWLSQQTLPDGNDGTFLLCKSLNMVSSILKSIATLMSPTASYEQSKEMEVDVEESGTDFDNADSEEEEDEDLQSGSQRRPIKAYYCFESGDQGYEIFSKLKSDIGKTILDVCKYVQTFREDDIESLKAILRAMRIYLNHRGIDRQGFADELRSYRYTKSLLRNGAFPNLKRYPRQILLRRLSLQENYRLRHNSLLPVKLDQESVEMEMIRQISSISTGNYAELRAISQDLLGRCLRLYKSIKYELLENLLKELQLDCQKIIEMESQGQEVPEWLNSKIKGSLYLISQHVFFNICLRNPKIVKLFAETMCQVVLIDKISIQSVVNEIVNEYVVKYCEAPLFSNPSAALLSLALNQDDVTAHMTRIHELRAKKSFEKSEWIHGYRKSLIQIYNSARNPHWRLLGVVIGLLELYNRDDVPIDEDLVEFICKSVHHDVLQIRRVAMVSILRIMYCFKKRSIRHLASTSPETISSYKLKVKSSELMSTYSYDIQSNKDLSTIIDRSDIGWLALPEEVTVYKLGGINPLEVFLCDPQDQEPITKLMQQLNSLDFWEKHFRFASMEAASSFGGSSNTSDETLNAYTMRFYKAVFQLMHDKILYDILIPKISIWCSTYSDKSLQRAALEFLTGLIRGMKHWSIKEKEKCWDWLLPTLKSMIWSRTPETKGLFNQFFVYISIHRHPVRLIELFEMFLKDPSFRFQPVSDSAFNEAKKMNFVRILFRNNSSRLSGYASELLKSSINQDNLSCRYKDCRESLGSLLWQMISSSCTNVDCVPVSNLIQKMKSSANCVIYSCFSFKDESFSSVQSIYAIVRKLQSDTELNKDPNGKSVVYGSNYSNSCKTILKFFLDAFTNGRSHLLLSSFLKQSESSQPFLQDVLDMQLAKDDKDLTEASQALLSFLPDIPSGYVFNQSAPLDLLNFLKSFVFAVKEAGDEDSQRRSKLRGLAMIQVIFFRNIFHISTSDATIELVFDLILRSLRDPLIEIRQLASITLSGLVRSCDESRLKRLCETFYEWLGPMRRRSVDSALTPPQLATYHSGILGLSALVLAHPYSVPKWMPDVLVRIAKYQSYPSPLSGTIRSLFAEFRRTHQDTWSDIIGKKQDYTEFYGHSFESSSSRRGNLVDEEKGVFTEAHLEALEGLLTSSGQYYARKRVEMPEGETSADETQSNKLTSSPSIAISSNHAITSSDQINMDFLPKPSETVPKSEHWTELLHNPLARFSSAFDLAKDSKLISYSSNQIIAYKGNRQESEFQVQQRVTHITTVYPRYDASQSDYLICSSVRDRLLFLSPDMSRVVSQVLLEPQEPSPDEAEIYRKYLAGEKSLENLFERLLSVEDKASLSPFSLECLKFKQDITDEIMKSIKFEWLQKPSFILQLDSLKKTLADERNTIVVVGTETRQIILLDATNNRILEQYQLDSVPAYICITGYYDLEFQIYVTCRNGKVYTIGRKGVEFFTSFLYFISGLTLTEYGLFVSCANSVLYHVDLGSKEIVRSIRLPANIIKLGIIDVKMRDKRYLAIALENKQIRFYQDFSLRHVSTLHLPETAINFKFGEYAGEKNVIAVVGRDGSLHVSLLRRSSLLEFEKRIGEGPPLDSRKLDLESEITDFKRNILINLHDNWKEVRHVYENDMNLLRTFVKQDLRMHEIGNSFATGRNGSKAINLEANLKMNVTISNYKNLSNLKIDIQNLSAADATPSSFLTLEANSNSIVLDRSLYKIPIIPPSRHLTLNIRLRLIDEKDSDDPKLVIALHQPNQSEHSLKQVLAAEISFKK